jgi:hypothetical protein
MSRKLSRPGLAIYCLIISIFMIDAGQPETAEWFVWFLLFFAWAIAPVAVLLLPRWPWSVLHWTGIAMAGSGLVGYGHTMYFAPPDGQAGLIFVFLPFLQWMGVGAGIVIAVVTGAMRRAESDS